MASFLLHMAEIPPTPKINTLLVHWNPTVFTVSSLYFPLTLVFPFLNAISIEMYCNFSHLKNVFWILFSPPNNMFIKQHDSLSLFKAEPCKRKIASSCFRVPFSSFDSHHPPYSTMPTKPLLWKPCLMEGSGSRATSTKGDWEGHANDSALSSFKEGK